MQSRWWAVVAQRRMRWSRLTARYKCKLHWVFKVRQWSLFWQAITWFGSFLSQRVTNCWLPRTGGEMHTLYGVRSTYRVHSVLSYDRTKGSVAAIVMQTRIIETRVSVCIVLLLWRELVYINASISEMVVPNSPLFCPRVASCIIYYILYFGLMDWPSLTWTFWMELVLFSLMLFSFLFLVQITLRRSSPPFLLHSRDITTYTSSY